MPENTTTIDREQREGLYELIRSHLGSVGDLCLRRRAAHPPLLEHLGLAGATGEPGALELRSCELDRGVRGALGRRVGEAAWLNANVLTTGARREPLGSKMLL